MNKIIKRIIIVIAGIVGVCALAFAALIGVLTATEFKPGSEEPVAIEKGAKRKLKLGQPITVATWNIGYGSLDETADFFMDGGKRVYTADREQTLGNMKAIAENLQKINPDLVMIQEIDLDSTRSNNVDERELISREMPEYSSSFAYNYKVLFVPFPIPPLGKVNSGVATFSALETTSATRVALPCPFGYPSRVANLKRGLLVNRVPIEGSEAELVVINLHLEAYDSGEGKAAQTAQLRDLIDSEIEAGNYVIAGGDFNQTFSNVDTSAFPLVGENFWKPGALEVGAFSGVKFLTGDKTPSCRSLDRALKGADPDPEKFQYYVIDGFIVSDNIKVNAVETKDLKFVNSDHNPVVMNLTLE